MKGHIQVHAVGVLPKTYVACKTSSSGCDFVGDNSIQQAIDAARGGDVVEIRPGTYNTSFAINTKSIYIQGAGKGETIVNGNVTVKGLLTTIAQVEQMTIQNSNAAGITIEGNVTFSLDRVEVLNHSGNGIEIRDKSTVVLKASRVSGNEVGIFINTTTLASIINSTISQNRSYGIHRASPTIQLFQLANSVVYSNGQDGMRIENTDLDTEFVTIENNIIMNNRGYGIFSTVDPFDLFYGHTIFFQNTQGCSNQSSICSAEGSLNDTDPQLVNPQLNDFHPQSTSPAIDAGGGEDPDGSPADIGLYGGLFACDYDGTPDYCFSGPRPTIPPPTSPPMSPIQVSLTQSPHMTGSPTLPGDANGDNQVTIADFEIWRSEFKNPGSGLRADFNGNETVDVKDFDIWRSAYTMN